jgi:uncharacterized protein
MNIDEREELVRFLEQLAQARAVRKDDEADALIRSSCAQQADATYLLVQRALLLEQAVRNSQREIACLSSELAHTRSQIATDRATPAFIDANSWGNSAAPRQTSTPPTPPARESGAGTAASAWGSGMLGTIASTAAGVVAGNFLFQGIEHLLGDRHSPSTPANAAPAPHDSAAIIGQQDDGAADIFDTRSVDDYIDGHDNT